MIPIIYRLIVQVAKLFYGKDKFQETMSFLIEVVSLPYLTVTFLPSLAAANMMMTVSHGIKKPMIRIGDSQMQN